MNSSTEVPFPQIERQTEDKSIKQEYEDLLAREQREAEAAEQLKLAGIDSTGNIEELLSNIKLRTAFIRKFGSSRFTALHAKHVRSNRELRQAADRTARMGKRTVTTTAGRLQQANAGRKAAQATR